MQAGSGFRPASGRDDINTITRETMDIDIETVQGLAASTALCAVLWLAVILVHRDRMARQASALQPVCSPIRKETRAWNTWLSA
jgi:hypothetical protein